MPAWPAAGQERGFPKPGWSPEKTGTGQIEPWNKPCMIAMIMMLVNAGQYWSPFNVTQAHVWCIYDVSASVMICDMTKRDREVRAVGEKKVHEVHVFRQVIPTFQSEPRNVHLSPTGFASEKGLAKHHLCCYATTGPPILQGKQIESREVQDWQIPRHWYRLRSENVSVRSTCSILQFSTDGMLCPAHASPSLAMKKSNFVSTLRYFKYFAAMHQCLCCNALLRRWAPGLATSASKYSLVNIAARLKDPKIPEASQQTNQDIGRFGRFGRQIGGRLCNPSHCTKARRSRPPGVTQNMAQCGVSKCNEKHEDMCHGYDSDMMYLVLCLSNLIAGEKNARIISHPGWEDTCWVTPSRTKEDCI